MLPGRPERAPSLSAGSPHLRSPWRPFNPLACPETPAPGVASSGRRLPQAAPGNSIARRLGPAGVAPSTSAVPLEPGKIKEDPPMSERIQIGTLSVAKALRNFIEHEAAPGTGLAPGVFWSALESILADLAPKNAALLARRDALQAEIDAWWLKRAGKPQDPDASREFLASIGYLLPEGPDFTITTANVDPEIALVAGPQLVVPLTNARYALNA